MKLNMVRIGALFGLLIVISNGCSSTEYAGSARTEQNDKGCLASHHCKTGNRCTHNRCEDIYFPELAK